MFDRGEIGNKHKVKLKVPIFTGALGSTNIARDNWEGMAIGARNFRNYGGYRRERRRNGSDSEIKNGRVVKSPELERRVKTFNEWSEGYGAIVLQQNVEDGKAWFP